MVGDREKHNNFDKTLSEVQESLESENMVILVGLSGVGKSHLVSALKSEYPEIMVTDPNQFDFIEHSSNQKVILHATPQELVQMDTNNSYQADNATHVLLKGSTITDFINNPVFTDRIKVMAEELDISEGELVKYSFGMSSIMHKILNSNNLNNDKLKKISAWHAALYWSNDEINQFKKFCHDEYHELLDNKFFTRVNAYRKKVDQLYTGTAFVNRYFANRDELPKSEYDTENIAKIFDTIKGFSDLDGIEFYFPKRINHSSLLSRLNLQNNFPMPSKKIPFNEDFREKSRGKFYSAVYIDGHSQMPQTYIVGIATHDQKGIGGLRPIRYVSDDVFGETEYLNAIRKELNKVFPADEGNTQWSHIHIHNHPNQSIKNAANTCAVLLRLMYQNKNINFQIRKTTGQLIAEIYSGQILFPEQ